MPALTGVLANDTGLGDGGIVLSVTIAPTSGVLTLNNDGSFSYTPNANVNGADTFTYQVQDADGDTSTATVTINVAAVNDAPVPGNNSFIFAAGNTAVISSANLSATDVESAPGTLLFSVTNVVNGQFEFVAAPGVRITSFTQTQIVTGQVQFVPSGGSAPSFDLSVWDGSALTGPYAANISYSGGTTPPAIGLGLGTPFVGAESSVVPPTTTGGALAFDSAPVAALALPVEPIGLLNPLGVGFIRTPLISSSVASEDSPAAFVLVDTGPSAQAAAGPLDAKVAASRDLPPIRAEGDVIETRIVDPSITVERLRADELGVQLSKYAYACVPESVDPSPAQMSIVPTRGNLELDAEEKWRLDVTFGALTVTGLAVAAGALWWAARASGLISGLLAASPTWRHIDPLPALGRDAEGKATRKAVAGKRVRPSD
jgi:VCBS repeat-containing protein